MNGENDGAHQISREALQIPKDSCLQCTFRSFLLFHRSYFGQRGVEAPLGVLEVNVGEFAACLTADSSRLNAVADCASLWYVKLCHQVRKHNTDPHQMKNLSDLPLILPWIPSCYPRILLQ
jgi:hypothetical protein